MKHLFFLASITFFALQVFAQTDIKPFIRTIEVTGSAELDVEPDEVYLSVNLREYMKEKNSKVYLTEIDKEFKKVLALVKIELKDVSIEGANAYYNYNYWRNESKRTDFLASKTYLIKLPNLGKYNELMQQLDNKGIENAYLQRTDNSKIEEYRQQVKINALKAAKAKAKLMVESIGSGLGDVVFIREINDGNLYRPVMYKAMSNMAMEDGSAANGGGEPAIQTEKIKIRYEVEAHFLIK
jgi:uncharacterized protein YggE